VDHVYVKFALVIAALVFEISCENTDKQTENHISAVERDGCQSW